MPRARNIKPSFFRNECLAELDPMARLLFAGLWCLADREGRLQDRPKRIKAEIFPYEECDTENLLNALTTSEFIVRYQIEGLRFIQVVNFKKHQNPYKSEKPSEIPAPPVVSAQVEQSIGKSTVEVEQMPIHVVLIPDSLSSDSQRSLSSPTVPTPSEVPQSKKRKQIPDERVRPVIDHFCQKYLTETGKPYAVSWAKDGKLIRELPKDYSIQDLCDLVDLFFANKADQFVWTQTGPTIGMFRTKIPLLATKLAGRKEDEQSCLDPTVARLMALRDKTSDVPMTTTEP